MLRFLTLLLLLMLPIQFAWSAAAVYCQHETSPAQSRHVGHHEHVHQDESKKPVSVKAAVDADCGFCNASVPQATMLHEASVPRPLPAVRVARSAVSAVVSASARAPDRPQWLRLA